MIRLGTKYAVTFSLRTLSQTLGAKKAPVQNTVPFSLLQTRGIKTSKGTFAIEAKEREKFVRTKEHYNIGTIGHVDHGKTSLTAAITKIVSERGGGKYISYGEIDKTPEEKRRGITISASHVEYQTERRHYAHIDCPGHQHYVKNMITGAAQMDGAILVCSAPDGPQEQTKEHIILAHEVGIPNLVCFLNKMDQVKDTGLVDLVEDELREMMTKYGFNGEKVPFVRGSALTALEETPDKASDIGRKSIEKLIQVIDEELPLPPRDADKPFLMAVEDIFVVGGRGTVVTGKIEQGGVKVGDEVALVGKHTVPKSTVAGIEMFRRQLDNAVAGDNIGLLLRGVPRESVARGDIICKPGSLNVYKKFQAKVYVLEAGEGGRKKGFGSNYQPQFFFRTANITGHIDLGGKDKIAMPGDNIEMTVDLISPAAMKEGMRFAMREGSLTVGAGVVTKILDAGK